MRQLLSPSEFRVAKMAASGMRNREIAQALFVTPKTVEWHLGQVYHKLGIRSRNELPTALQGAPDDERTSVEMPLVPTR